MADPLTELREVMARLRVECPWDADQTHLSLVTYLVEETCEVIEAIETREDGGDADLVEELGDLLLQVVFHSEIAAQEGRFTLDDVADGITAKLIRRHPYVFAEAEIPDDLTGTWEQRKAAEKGRTSSLEGIPARLSALAHATKVLNRAHSRQVRLDLPTPAPITADELGSELKALVVRAQASGLDAEQVMRTVARDLEAQVRAAEAQERTQLSP